MEMQKHLKSTKDLPPSWSLVHNPRTSIKEKKSLFAVCGTWMTEQIFSGEDVYPETHIEFLLFTSDVSWSNSLSFKYKF